MTTSTRDLDTLPDVGSFTKYVHIRSYISGDFMLFCHIVRSFHPMIVLCLKSDILGRQDIITDYHISYIFLVFQPFILVYSIYSCISGSVSSRASRCTASL